MNRLPNTLDTLASAISTTINKAQTVARLGAAPSSTSPIVLAQVNGKAIQSNLFEMALQDKLRAGAQDSLALREAVRRDMVVQTLLVDLAEKAHLDKAPATELRVTAARNAVLAQAWQQHWLDAHPPTEEEVKTEYDELKARTGTKEYQIRQVVLRDETAAKLVMEQITAGKSMADMAAQYSIEPLGKDDGGLMPWATPNQLVEPLNQVVPASVGKRLSEAVRTANGFHIVEVLAERPFEFPPFEQMRAQCVQSAAQRKLSAAIQEQLNAAKIELR